MSGVEQHLRADGVLVDPCVGERAVDVGWIQLVVTLHSEENDDEALAQQPLLRPQHVRAGIGMIHNTNNGPELAGLHRQIPSL